MTIDLVPPHMDKGWSFQVSEPYPNIIPTEVSETLLSLIRTPIVRRAKPFVQSNCLGFIMIEFWTDDEDLILQAWQFIEGGLK